MICKPKVPDLCLFDFKAAIFFLQLRYFSAFQSETIITENFEMYDFTMFFTVAY